jgi:hypothetical protein
MDYTVYYISIPIIVAIAVIGWALFKRAQRTVETEIPVLPTGWQFFPNLTTGDPPGTIFRITPEKQRFEVGEAKGVPIHTCIEASGKKTEKTEINTSMLVRILGLNLVAGLEGNQKEEIVFEMDDSRRETTTDEEIDDLLKKIFAGLTLRPHDRYFVIRETSATKQIAFELKKDLVERLGGEAKMQEKIEVKATVFSKKNSTTFELKRNFDELMRVMFNAEEITLKKSEITFRGPGAPSPKSQEFIRSPVKESLEWTSAK